MPIGLSTPLAATKESRFDSSVTALRQASDADKAKFETALQRAQETPRTTSTRGMQEVPRRPTVLTGEQAAGALSHAWQQALGSTPSKGTLSVLTAQWAHETGRGKSMMNFNFGGIKGTGPSGLTTSYATHEGFGKTETRIVDGFRAYDSAEQGAADYLSLLVRRYPDAIAAAEQESPSGFVQALRKGGYFTGDPASYTRSISQLAAQAYDQGFGAVGATNAADASITQQPANPSTHEYFSMPIEVAALQNTSRSADSLQSFLATEQVSRVSLLLSSLPAFGMDGPSNDSEPTKS